MQLFGLWPLDHTTCGLTRTGVPAALCTHPAAATAIGMRGIVPIPGIAYLILPIGTGLFGALPFPVDRLMVGLFIVRMAA